MIDRLGNMEAREGVDFCFCGCKYWENDRCIDCKTSIHDLRRFDETLDAYCDDRRDGIRPYPGDYCS